ncbi:MAG: DUF2752 domain-containing protein [Actinomycetota bacterium]|nr:DUF2752 domain-containing protein [Acidimicrobiia bacterium]MDQ3147294.1 DUF2752 domain-containing protein [Actinomycetota bacterium]
MIMLAARPRRPFSAPERFALVGAGLVPVAALYPWLSERSGLHALCPLREITGIPCPFCGGTTAASGLAGGEVGHALAANPFVAVLATVVLGVLALMAARAAGLAPPPRAWDRTAQRRLVALVGGTVLASWIVQLHRFGFL